MLLLDSGKYNADSAGVIGAIHAILEKHKVEVVASRPWEERRLMYQIRHHKKGTYYLIYFKSDGTTLRPIQDDFALFEPIIRNLVLKIHPKMIEPMLNMAKDEHALALRAPGLADDVDPMTGR
ncbi:MAG TPA: 30S ribosomal protein S6 [Gemmatales bacterium]|nr:30S ribosomal protein S6 [Gemmatales bacterium]